MSNEVVQTKTLEERGAQYVADMCREFDKAAAFSLQNETARALMDTKNPQNDSDREKIRYFAAGTYAVLTHFCAYMEEIVKESRANQYSSKSLKEFNETDMDSLTDEEQKQLLVWTLSVQKFKEALEDIADGKLDEAAEPIMKAFDCTEPHSMFAAMAKSYAAGLFVGFDVSDTLHTDSSTE